MAASVTIHYGKARIITPPAKLSPQAAPAQAQPQAQPVAVPAQDQYRTVVRPRFIGDSFVYVPERVPTVNPDGTPIKSPGEAFLDWLFGTNR